MESKVRVFGHPLHTMLVVFPLGLLATSVIFDVVHLVSGRADMSMVAFWLIIAGLIGGAIAAPFGSIDWLSIPRNTRAKRIGGLHGAGNAIVLVLFAVSAWLRGGPGEVPPTLAYVLSFGAAGLATLTGWLGGELVTRLGVGVYPQAHVDAGSSLDAADAASVTRDSGRRDPSPVGR